MGPGNFKKRSARRGPKPNHQPGKRNLYALVAPLFVPRTQDGTLVRRMREVEEGLAKFSHKLMPKIKMVEQGGLMLKHILINSDPWKDWPCSHPQCSTSTLAPAGSVLWSTQTPVFCASQLVGRPSTLGRLPGPCWRGTRSIRGMPWHPRRHSRTRPATSGTTPSRSTQAK